MIFFVARVSIKISNSVKSDDDDKVVDNPNESITNITTSFNKSIEINDKINNDEVIDTSKNDTKCHQLHNLFHSH